MKWFNPHQGPVDHSKYYEALMRAYRPNRYKSPEDFEKRNFIPYFAKDSEGKTIINPEWTNAEYEEVFTFHSNKRAIKKHL